MKYLYVLVSNTKDYYSEQAFISIYSLKLKTPNAFVSLLVDDLTSEYLKNNFQELLKSVHEVKVIELDSKYSNKEKSRILKTTMRQHIDGDFLFIDCDTVICEDLSEIEKCECDIGCVLDNHVKIDKHWCKDFFITNAKKCGFEESILSNTHFNSGVIYCKDNPKTHNFFAQWYSLWNKTKEKGIIIDQTSFNQVNAVENWHIKELDGKWNCQIINGGCKFLANAKIIHYFATLNPIFGNPYLIDDKNIFEEIKAKHFITESVKDMLDNPRNLIDCNSTLLGSTIPRGMLYFGSLFHLVYLYKKSKFLYKCFSFILGKLYRFINYIAL